MLLNNSSTIRPVIIGNFSPTTLACIRSWGKQGFHVGMICIRSDKDLYPNSKYLKDFITISLDRLFTENGIRRIFLFLKKFKASRIFCINENIAIWLNNHSKLLPKEVTFCISPNHAILNLISKNKQIEIARKIGFTVLPTYYIDKNMENNFIPEHFPLCLRPNDPKTVKPSFKVNLVYSSEELKTFVNALIRLEKPLIAQPFMNLPNLVVHGARTVSGSSIGLQAFIVNRKFEGVTLTIRPTNLDNILRDKCIAFTNQFELTGNYHFEFLINEHTGAKYFLELNNRFGGTTAKVYGCGYDEPMIALQAYGIKTENENRVIRNVIVSNKQALFKYLLYIVQGRLSPLDYPSETNVTRVAKAIYGLLIYKDDVLMLRDFRGALAFYFGNIRNGINLQRSIIN